MLIVGIFDHTTLLESPAKGGSSKKIVIQEWITKKSAG